jgi:DMSO/TMAO reductase YedYZ molybdopterin-dependent catalytic subunit
VTTHEAPAAEGGSRSPAWLPTPLASLRLQEIPTALHFVRDHFPVPTIDPATWKLSVVGERRQLALKVADLRARPRRTLRVVLECAGHRRTEMRPVPAGIPWGVGAVGEARWTGASLAAVLHHAGIPPGTVEVVLDGADWGEIDGLPGSHRFARSLPLAKALSADVLLAYEMNGEPIPVARGGPVRAIVPGWYATDSVKWLARIWFARERFDGFFQTHEYRRRRPGEAGPGRRMAKLPIHGLITGPADGESLAAGACLVRGVAWGGEGGVAQVLVRVDRGPWRATSLAPARGRYARTPWELPIELSAGSHEIACRAQDGKHNAQPDRPRPDVGGYANHSIHRVRVLARGSGLR